MADTLNLEINDVSEPNANGWYEVEFSDGTKASTKSEELAKQAFQSRGTIATVVISEQKSGKFTNRYLNEINGVKDAPRPRGKTTSSGTSRTPEQGERIARQWAYGRAVELLIASDTNFDFPLSSENMSALSEMATALINATK